MMGRQDIHPRERKEGPGCRGRAPRSRQRHARSIALRQLPNTPAQRKHGRAEAAQKMDPSGEGKASERRKEYLREESWW